MAAAAFPRPATVGQCVWTIVAVLYAVLIVVGTVYEALWLLDFDEAANGSPIPIFTIVFTAPTGWVGAVLGMLVAKLIGAGPDGSTVIVWTAMGCFGVLQTWVIWRTGLGRVFGTSPTYYPPPTATHIDRTAS